MKNILKFAGVVLFLYGSFCIFLFLSQESLMFFPLRESINIPQYNNIEEIFIETKDGVKLNALFLDNKSDKTVVFFHGNGGNISYNQERIRIFNDLQLNALFFDYRGYGKSEGVITKEEDLYVDAESAFRYLTDKKNINANNIILWGQSLGGSVAVDTAQNKNIHAVIIESTFYSMDEMASNQYWFFPTKLLLRFKFENNKKIKNINTPILFIHSKNDEIISFSNGERLFDLANNPKKFLETSGSHNGGFKKDYPLYVSELILFLESI